MGGKALTNTPTRRIGKAEYTALAADCVLRFKKAFPSAQIEPIRAYFDKPSFGDIDLIVSGEQLGADWVKKGIDALGATDFRYEKNAPVVSIGYCDFQVDLIRVKEGAFHYARGYYAWNDLGNFIGKTARGLNLRFGFEGLWKSAYSGNEGLGRVLVSLDFEKSLNFLGYDANQHEKGFQTLEEIWEYATTSQWFDPQLFAPESMNHRSRTRDLKRSNYTGLLEWIDTHKGSYPESKTAQLDDQQKLELVFEAFPDFKERWFNLYARQAEILEYRERSRSIFGGDLIGETLNLRGPLAGKVLTGFRIELEKNPNWARHATRSKIQEQLKEFYATHQSDFEHEAVIELPKKRPSA